MGFFVLEGLILYWTNLIGQNLEIIFKGLYLQPWNSMPVTLLTPHVLSLFILVWLDNRQQVHL